MKIIKPSVKLIDFSDNIQQIGYAASVCYNSNKKGTIEWLDALWKNGHKSVFRHGTEYYIIPTIISDSLITELKSSSFVNTYEDVNNKELYLSTNCQFIKEHSYFRYLQKYKTSEDNFCYYANRNNCLSEVNKLIRITFEIVTQVSTSRELNRVSPNNICEQSTRYCDFTKGKFEGHIKFCEPHWLDVTTYYNAEKEEESDERIIFRENNKMFALVGNANLELNSLYPVATKGIPMEDNSALAYSHIIAMNWIKTCLDAEDRYFENIKYGMRPEDARGLLPLDLATICVYTYSIKEWEHFLDLRYYGKTGKPHSNAKIVAGMIKNYLDKL